MQYQKIETNAATLIKNLAALPSSAYIFWTDKQNDIIYLGTKKTCLDMINDNIEETTIFNIWNPIEEENLTQN